MTFEEFRSEYEDLVSAVSSSGYTNYSMRLRDWLDFLEDSDISRDRIRALEKMIDFKGWYESANRAHGLAGSGDLPWARDRTERLGQLIGLFRHFADEDMSFTDFSLNFLYAGSQFDDMIYKINTELFDQFSRDLLKDLARAYEQGGARNAPASDRIVTLDHNSAAYRDVTDKLAELQRVAETSNELAANHPAERERVVAELDAGRRLLRAVTVRAETVWSVLRPALAWLGEKSTDSIVGILVGAVAVILAGLLGISIPGL
jgi:hypothetical protein